MVHRWVARGPLLGVAALLALPAMARAQRTWTEIDAIGYRAGHAMATDLARNRVVLFDASSSASDTWLWDGSAWTRQRPSATPLQPRGLPFALDPAMAYDTQRQRVLLSIYGTSQDTELWEWDGADWQQRQPARSPPPRIGQVMVYDASRSRAVLFGGYDGAGQLLNDTWEWDGVAWLPFGPTTNPPPRVNAAAAYDPARGRMVMFGGSGTTGVLSDTWEWDGTSWRSMPSPVLPPARREHCMAFDPTRGRVVMFGGEDASLTALGDTWEWDGLVWSQRVSAPAPAPSARAAMAYDPVRARVMMFGGAGIGGETWEWANGAWSLRRGNDAPPGLGALTYDAARAESFVLQPGRQPAGRLHLGMERQPVARRGAGHPTTTPPRARPRR